VCLHPGDVLFAAPNCWNFPTWQREGEILCLLFGKKQLGLSLVSTRAPGKPILAASKFAVSQPVNGPLPHLLQALLELHQTRQTPEAFPPLIQALLHCVRHLVLETPTPESDGRTQSFFERICIFLQSNYQNSITRDSVAAQFGVTPNHLSRLFHTHGHMTFIDYLTHVRIDRGKHLLCTYNLKLDDIAVRCGFRDAPYFCRVFKRLTKTTPADYRARRLQHLEKANSPKPPAA
jgi:AraC-like DNA-binding protein